MKKLRFHITVHIDPKELNELAVRNAIAAAIGGLGYPVVEIVENEKIKTN